MSFERKVTVQVHDSFPAKSDVASVLREILEQRVPGELRIATSGNGAVRSIVFHGQTQTHRGSIEKV